MQDSRMMLMQDSREVVNVRIASDVNVGQQNDTGLMCKDIGLMCNDIGLMCNDIGLMCNDIGLMCDDIGLMCIV